MDKTYRLVVLIDNPKTELGPCPLSIIRKADFVIICHKTRLLSGLILKRNVVFKDRYRSPSRKISSDELITIMCSAEQTIRFDEKGVVSEN